jgi:hypothetical protein
MDKMHQIDQSDSQCPSREMSEDSDSTPFLGGKRKATRLVRISRSPYMFILDAVLVITALCLFVFLHKTHITLLDSQGDISGFVPNFRHQLVVFEQHPEFISNHTSEASLADVQKYWKTLIPRN